MRPAPYANRLVIMVKAPVMGRVKTRLAREIGPVRATAACRHMLAAALRSLGGDPRWESWIAIEPPTALGLPVWPPNLFRTPQRGRDLGKRMQALLDGLPPGPVVIVGSDVPGLRAADVAAAFAALGDNDAVLGPATDGGYWLVGARRGRRILRPFARVRWSGPHALEDTLANLEGARVALLRRLDDVDDAAGWRRWRRAGRTRLTG